MKLLLDTNSLLWQLGLGQPGRLGPKAKKYMLQAEVVYTSAISLVEMQIKTMLGKLDVPKNSAEMVTGAGNQLLPFSPASADATRNFPNLRRHDPFDRMLLAQAADEGLTFLTADLKLLELKLPYVIDARE